MKLISVIGDSKQDESCNFSRGWGSRLGQLTQAVPKPMVKIGGKPVLWHIMKTYSYYGFNEFVIALGVKGEVIKNYFYNFELNNSDYLLIFQMEK